MKANYADWSSGATDPEPWRMGELTLDTVESRLEMFLTRKGKLLNTFMLVLDEEAAKQLRDYLNKEFPDEQRPA